MAEGGGFKNIAGALEGPARLGAGVAAGVTLEGIADKEGSKSLWRLPSRLVDKLPRKENLDFDFSIDGWSRVIDTLPPTSWSNLTAGILGAVSMWKLNKMRDGATGIKDKALAAAQYITAGAGATGLEHAVENQGGKWAFLSRQADKIPHLSDVSVSTENWQKVIDVLPPGNWSGTLAAVLGAVGLWGARRAKG